ncbi:MAG TPA: hypothetical protein VN541_07150, partial [Tepidisphaeraceae bacterium]|nr:hypothetical protein [Tepidisphaeraceae bacterium]
MSEFLFDAPLWLPAILLIVGIFVLIRGNNRQMPAMRNAGAAVILLAIAWAVLSFVVDTPRKICERLTAQAVRAAADRDWKTFDSLLSPDADAR